jgi:hypothetical protein
VERWVDINGYEGLYRISDKGRVLSLGRKVVSGKSNKCLFKTKSRIIKQRENSRGYFRVLLHDGKGGKEYFFVHRLVAFHFVENKNPRQYTVVNHLDANPHNNTASNLEWTTIKGNMNHAAKLGHMDRTAEWLKNLRKYHESAGRSVIGTNIETGEEMFFVCLNDVKKQGFQPSCVCNCCRGRRATHC